MKKWTFNCWPRNLFMISRGLGLGVKACCYMVHSWGKNWKLRKTDGVFVVKIDFFESWNCCQGPKIEFKRPKIDPSGLVTTPSVHNSTPQHLKSTSRELPEPKFCLPMTKIQLPEARNWLSEPKHRLPEFIKIDPSWP